MNLPYDDERLYTQSEVLQVLQGLLNVYWSQSWLSRIFYKPWYDAIATAMLIFGADKFTQEMDNAKLMDDIEEHLN